MAEKSLADESGPRHFIAGRVLSIDNQPIEHIRVTVDWDGGSSKSVNYTASDGGFAAEIPQELYSPGMTVTLTMEDIDGEENGGLFETITDRINISGSPENTNGILVYRLNRATASENSPQS